MKNVELVVLVVGLLGVVVSAFGGLLAPLGYVGAGVAGLAMVWQYTSTRPVEIAIAATDWNAPTPSTANEYSYLIPKETARGRRKVVVTSTIDGETHQVETDVLFASGGSIELRAGSRVDVTVHVT